VAITVREGTRDRPGKKGYTTLTADTAEDVKKLRGSELHKKIRQQGVNSIEKQMDGQRQGETIRYPNGMKLRMETAAAEDAIKYMRRHAPKGPPAVRISVTMGAYFKTMPDGSKRLVREGEEDY